MKTVKKGRAQKGWAKEYICTGKGNGGGRCNAVLLVEQGDLFRTERHCLSETDVFVTFSCQECGVLTDIEGFPGYAGQLPTQSEWRKRRTDEATS